MGIFNWVLNLVPVLNTVVGWFRKVFSIKLVAFLVMKGIIFYLAYKFLPFFVGRAFQWIYNIGVATDTLDLSDFLNVIDTGMPTMTGLGGWLLLTLKLDTCLRIYVAGALARLKIKHLPFFAR